MKDQFAHARARIHTHLINQSNVYSKHETCMENGDHLVTRRIRRIIGRFWTWNLVHESNFHGVLLVINRWSNYSTCRYIRIVGGYFNVARLWCSTTREKKTPLERDRCSQIRWPFANTSLYTLFPISFWTSSRIVLFWIFQLSRKKEGPFFFFSVTGLTVFILTGLEPQVVPAIRLRMAFRGIMGHSLWKFPKELSSLEGGKSFRRTRYKARLSIKLSKNSFACVNFYACIPMNRSWRAKNLWELCMSITYDRIFKFFTAIFIETDRNIVRVAVNCLIRQLSSFRALISWRINYTLKFRKI